MSSDDYVPPAQPATTKGTWGFGLVITALTVGLYGLAIVMSMRGEGDAEEIKQIIFARDHAPHERAQTTTSIHACWRSAIDIRMDTECTSEEPALCAAGSLDAIAEAVRRHPPKE